MIRELEKYLVASSVLSFLFWCETVPRELTKLYDAYMARYQEVRNRG